jgi:predicted lipid-binding transport protein (Tim44 family)
MSESFPYADLVILALVAGFILLRLRSVLGSRMGNDNPGYFSKPLAPAPKPEPIVQLDEKSLRARLKEEIDPYMVSIEGTPIAETLGNIKSKDLQFSASHFLQGARGAYEMVFDAFVKGDRQTLKMLLSETLFQQFSKELDGREGQEKKTETTLVSVKPKEITEASLDKNTARLTVHFESEQVTVVRGPKGDILEGNPSELHHVEDHWTFERDTTSKNPNWKIIET